MSRRYCQKHDAMTFHVAREQPPFGADCLPCLYARANRRWAAAAGVAFAVLIIVLAMVKVL